VGRRVGQHGQAQGSEEGQPVSTDRPPSKRWRVHGARGISTDHRSERAAYEAAKSILATGARITIHHWENGSWRLYERIDPARGENL
jgi:hypothetical protein